MFCTMWEILVAAKDFTKCTKKIQKGQLLYSLHSFESRSSFFRLANGFQILAARTLRSDGDRHFIQLSELFRFSAALGTVLLGN